MRSCVKGFEPSGSVDYIQTYDDRTARTEETSSRRKKSVIGVGVAWEGVPDYT